MQFGEAARSYYGMVRVADAGASKPVVLSEGGGEVVEPQDIYDTWESRTGMGSNRSARSARYLLSACALVVSHATAFLS
jgi:hypothetical protein